MDFSGLSVGYELYSSLKMKWCTTSFLFFFFPRFCFILHSCAVMLQLIFFVVVLPEKKKKASDAELYFCML